MLHTVYKAQYLIFTCANINSHTKNSIYTNGRHSECVCDLCEGSAVLTVYQQNVYFQKL